MVRATRSSAALQSQQGSAEHTLPTKKHNKKRKRASNVADSEEQRSAKHPRSESKHEDEEPGTGDLPLNPQDATKILDVLEMCVSLILQLRRSLFILSTGLTPRVYLTGSSLCPIQTHSPPRRAPPRTSLKHTPYALYSRILRRILSMCCGCVVVHLL